MVPKIRIPGIKVVFPTLRDLLCAHGEQAFILDDFSKFARLRQDGAGAVPVTGVGQDVGWMGDDAGFAYQSDPSKCAVVSARVNLLTKTEMADGWAASLGGVDVLPGYFGSDNGLRVTQSVVTYGDQPSKNIFLPTVAGTAVTISAVVDMATSTAPVFGLVALGFVSGGGVATVAANIDAAGNVTIASAAGATGVAVAAAHEYSDVWKLTVTGTFTAGNSQLRFYTQQSDGGSVVVGRIQFETGTDTNSPYQSVNTATDYDTAGFPHYLIFDGASDFYSSTAGGASTGGMYLACVVTVSAAVVHCIFDDGRYKVYVYSDGTVGISGNGASYFCTEKRLAIGVRSLVEIFDDGVNIGVRVDGIASPPRARVMPAAGAGGFTIGRRKAAAANYFNGRMYSYVYRDGPAPSQATRDAVAQRLKRIARLP